MLLHAVRPAGPFAGFTEWYGGVPRGLVARPVHSGVSRGLSGVLTPGRGGVCGSPERDVGEGVEPSIWGDV